MERKSSPTKPKARKHASSPKSKELKPDITSTTALGERKEKPGRPHKAKGVKKHTHTSKSRSKKTTPSPSVRLIVDPLPPRQVAIRPAYRPVTRDDLPLRVPDRTTPIPPAHQEESYTAPLAAPDHPSPVQPKLKPTPLVIPKPPLINLATPPAPQSSSSTHPPDKKPTPTKSISSAQESLEHILQTAGSPTTTSKTHSPPATPRQVASARSRSSLWLTTVILAAGTAIVIAYFIFR